MSSQKLRLISAAVRVNMQFLCCWRLRNQHELDAVIEELSALLPKEQLYRLYEQATREPYTFLFVYYLKPRNEMFYKRFEERFALEKDADGSGAQLPGPEAVRQLHADHENISCCTSVAVQPPVVRRTGGFLKKRMTTIYVDSRKRVAGSDSDFEVDLGESLHLQSGTREDSLADGPPALAGPVMGFFGQSCAHARIDGRACEWWKKTPGVILRGPTNSRTSHAGPVMGFGQKSEVGIPTSV